MDGRVREASGARETTPTRRAPRRSISWLAWVLLWVGCVAAPADPEQLMEADRAFSLAVSEGGSTAWAEWFTEDGAIVREGIGEIRGRDAVREAAAFLDVPGVSLTWEPERADISEGGDLGWTTGRYASLAPSDSGPPIRGTGVYVSIWRLQPDGSWRVVMDLGNPIDRGTGG